MNEKRYDQLLGRLLDDELGPDETKEFADWLSESPSARSDVQLQLFLWDLYAQQQCPERASHAFAAAFQTRLLAEADPKSFVGGVEARLRQAAAHASGAIAGTSGSATLVQSARRLLYSLRWIFGGALATAIVVFCLWLFPTVNNQPTLSVAANIGATIERDGNVSAAPDGARLLPGDVLTVSGTNAVAVIYGREATKISVDAGTQLKILPWSEGKRFGLRAGKIEATVARQRPWQPMTWTTAQAEARVLGTHFTLSATTNATQLDVTEGKVRFTRASDGASVLVMTGNGAVASKDVELTVQPLTRGILREYWTNVTGLAVITLTSHSNFPDHPHGRDQLDNFEARSELGQNYGERLRGYLHPPITGEYRFWIATGDGHADLLLSPDDKPENRRQIARSLSSGPRVWDRSGQQSTAISLVAGRKYYLEALHKQNSGNDYCAVAWQAPGGEREVIPGRYLSPFKPKQ